MTSIRDIAVHGDDLVDRDARPRVLGHGRCRAAAAGRRGASRRGGDYLFAPAAAYRVRPGNEEGTPLPLDEPHAANPPDRRSTSTIILRGAGAHAVGHRVVDGKAACCGAGRAPTNPPPSIRKSLPSCRSWILVPPSLSDERRRAPFRVGLPRRSSLDGPLAPPGTYTDPHDRRTEDIRANASGCCATRASRPATPTCARSTSWPKKSRPCAKAPAPRSFARSGSTKRRFQPTEPARCASRSRAKRRPTIPTIRSARTRTISRVFSTCGRAGVSRERG